jgi:hypothetical protein
MNHLTIAVIVAALGAVYTAHAATLDLRHLTCKRAQELVQTKQSVALAYGNTWDTYVSDDGQCPAGMKTVPAFVVSKDTHGSPACHIVSRCAGSDVNTNDGGDSP